MSVTFLPNDIANFNTLKTNVRVVVTKAPQTITFDLPPTATFASNGLIPLVATSSSGLPVTNFVSGNTNALRIVGTNAVMRARGTNIAVTATNLGSLNYLPAGTTRSITLE